MDWLFFTDIERLPKKSFVKSFVEKAKILCSFKIPQARLLEEKLTWQNKSFWYCTKSDDFTIAVTQLLFVANLFITNVKVGVQQQLDLSKSSNMAFIFIYIDW